MNNPLVQPDPGLFIWTILTFLVLLALLSKFAWRPLLVALHNRQERIRLSLEGAKAAREEMERARREAAELLRQARIEADGIVSASRSDAERAREEIKQKARNEAAGILAAAERRIEVEASQARQQVRQEAADPSILIASKLIRRNLSPADNRALIDDVIGSFGKQH